MTLGLWHFYPFKHLDLSFHWRLDEFPPLVKYEVQIKIFCLVSDETLTRRVFLYWCVWQTSAAHACVETAWCWWFGQLTAAVSGCWNLRYVSDVVCKTADVITCDMTAHAAAQLLESEDTSEKCRGMYIETLWSDLPTEDSFTSNHRILLSFLKEIYSLYLIDIKVIQTFCHIKKNVCIKS